MQPKQFNILIIGCCLLVLQSTVSQGLRIKRSYNQTTSEPLGQKGVTLPDAVTSSTEAQNLTATTAASLTTEGENKEPTASTKAIDNGNEAIVKLEVVIEATPQLLNPLNATRLNTKRAVNSITDNLNKTSASILPKATDTLKAVVGAGLTAAKQIEVFDESSPHLVIESSTLHRNKRRMDEPLSLPVSPLTMFNSPPISRHRRHHGTSGSPPYVYYNKLVSPDGKQELKQFEVVSPNMMIESVQQEVNYGPEILPASGEDLDGVIVVSAGNGPLESLHAHSHGSKYHRKHKPANSMLPMAYMLQQMIQSPIDTGLPIPLVNDGKAAQHHSKTPLYQFIDRAVDLALRNNHDSFDQLLSDRTQGQFNKQYEDKEQYGNQGKNSVNALKLKAKDETEAIPSNSEDALIVSCPIHHEHHTDKTGALVDDEVVVVDECQVI